MFRQWWKQAVARRAWEACRYTIPGLIVRSKLLRELEAAEEAIADDDDPTSSTRLSAEMRNRYKVRIELLAWWRPIWKEEERELLQGMARWW